MLGRERPGDDRDAAERAHAEQREVEHRVLARVPRSPTKATINTAASDERADDLRRAPALGVAADQAEDQAEEGEREGDDAGAVDRLRVGGRDVREPRLRDHDRGEPDRDVDEEDPLPAEGVGDRAADERPDRDRGAERRAPDADRLGRARGPRTPGRSAQGRWRTWPRRPRPAAPRKRFRTVGSLARPQSSEATVNTAKPDEKIRRRPSRSPSEPKTSRNEASVSA